MALGKGNGEAATAMDGVKEHGFHPLILKSFTGPPACSWAFTQFLIQDC